jgi:hypothetical protein
MKTLLPAAALALALATPALAANNQITCTGILIEVDTSARANWPLSVIWDIEGKYASTINREGSGHDPLRGCNVGEKCRVVGTFLKIGQTYSIKTLISLTWIDK